MDLFLKTIHKFTSSEITQLNKVMVEKINPFLYVYWRKRKVDIIGNRVWNTNKPSWLSAKTNWAGNYKNIAGIQNGRTHYLW
jgi:hypothetical protein